MSRNIPYGAFNFQVDLGDGNSDSLLGGFSDVSGLGTEFTIAEYRVGNDKEKYNRKVVLGHKSSDVTLRRGLIDAGALWRWISEVRQRGSLAQRSVTVRLYDEGGTQAVQTWKLHGVVPLRWTGPTLAAKATGDVAMEELVLSVENLTLEDT